MTLAVTVFFGSQTGAAESIAQRFYDEALERQYDADLLPLNEFQNSKVTETPGHHVVIVCSTTGNGEPPDNAGKFWRYVKRRTQPKDMLANLHFTVLGLGDTNYDKFCYMGKSIDKRFAELGAQRFYDMGAADEALGLEDSVEPWAAKLWSAFETSAGAGDAATDTSSEGDAASDASSSTAASDAADAPMALPYLPANLITYDAMFGPFAQATEIPSDVPKLPSALFALRYVDDASIAASPATVEAGDYSSTHPFTAAIAAASYLTAPHAERKVLRLALDITGSGITYTPGDSIGIKCPNRASDVDALLARLELDGDQRFCLEPVAPAATGRAPRRPAAAKSGAFDRFPSPCSVREAFTHYADILSSPKKAALRALATYCGDDEERARLLVLSSKSGADQYKRFISDQALNFVELLHLFPSCAPPLDHLLSLMPQLMPRFYSIASSPLANPSELTIALTVVDSVVGSSGLHRLGLCSNWLDAIAQPLLLSPQDAPRVTVPMFLRPTRDFQLPASHAWPLLLIGPGTGVAPFIGFLQHRYLEVKHHEEQASDVCSGYWRGDMALDMEEDAEFATAPALAASKGNYLFFGNRRRADDWLFQREMEDFVANGTLKQLFTAFSRDQATKHYVQHELEANGALVADLVFNAGGYIYVCGDGVQMARDVHNALSTVLQEHGQLSKDDAEAKLSDLAARQRYPLSFRGYRRFALATSTSVLLRAAQQQPLYTVRPFETLFPMAQHERVVEYFVVAVKSQDDREAELAFAYPNGDSESTRELCEGVAMFMFPHAFGQDWDKRSLPPPPMHNLFALTDVSGEHLYGASLCFYETLLVSEAPPPPLASNSNDDDESSSNNESTSSPMTTLAPTVALPAAAPAVHGVQYQAKAICLLSKRPFYTQLLRCLEQLFLLGTRQARANSDAAALASSSAMPVHWHGVEKTLCNLFHEVPVPHRGLAVQLTVGDVDIVLERPLLQDFPFEMDAELMTYAFMMVEPKVMLQLYHHVLLEHRILVVCADSVLVTAITEAIKCLAFPLTWLHVYIPHIPDSLDLSTLLEAPVPFIAGAHTQQLANVAIPPNVVKLVFTAGKFVLGPTAAASEVALPPLPDASQKLATKLGTLRLPDFTAQKREFHEKLWNRRIQLQKLCMSSTSVQPPAASSLHSSSSSSSDVASSSSILAKALFLTRPNALYRKVMKLYLEIMASLLRAYPQFVSSDGNQTAFESERFIERKPPSERVFYREFVHTALFQSFLAQHNDHLSGALSRDEAVKLQFVHRRLLSDHEDDARGSFAVDSSASKTFVAHAPQLPALPVATRKRSFVLPTRLSITGSTSISGSNSASDSARRSITLEPVNVSIRFPDIDVSAFGEPRTVIFPAAAHDATTSSLGTFLHTSSSTTRHSTASKDVGVEWMQQLMKNVSLSTGPFKRRDVLTSTTGTPALSSAVFKRSRTIDRILSKSSPSTLPTALGASTASPFYRTMTQRALESTNSIFRATGTSHTLKTQQQHHDSATRAAPVVRSIWLITTSACTCSGDVVALTEALTHVLEQHERNSSAASDAYCALIDCLGACGHASEAKAVFEECLSGSHLVTLAPLARYKHFWKPFSSLMRCYVRNGLVQRAFDVLVQVEIDEEQHLDPALGSLCFGAQVLGSESEVLVERIYATFSCGNLGLYLAARDTGSGAEVVACESLAEQQRDSTNNDEDNNNKSDSDGHKRSTPHTTSVREYDVVETINGEVVLQSSLQQVVHCLKQAYRPVTITFLRGLPKLESLMNDSSGSAMNLSASQRGTESSAIGNLADTQQQQQQLDDHDSKFRPRKDLCDRFGLLPQRGIRITTLADCTSCGARATLREIQDGWSVSDANDYTTRCARCSHRYVPRLCVTLGAMTAFYQPPPPVDSDGNKRADAASSAPSQVRVEQCEYLSMLVIRKELANVAQKLPLTMLSMAELRELNPRIYWNIVVKLLSLAYPLDFLDLPDATQSPLQDLSDAGGRDRAASASFSSSLGVTNGRKSIIATVPQHTGAENNDTNASLDSDARALQGQFMLTLTRLHATRRGHATWEHTLAATLAHLEHHAREHSPDSITHAQDERVVDARENDDDSDEDDDERRSCRTVSLVESSSTCTGDDDDEPVAKPRARGGSLRLAPFQRKARTTPLSK